MNESNPEFRAPHQAGDSRRDLLRKGAVVGGLVWAAPVINSAGRLAAEGSPPVNSTTTFPEVVTTTTTGSTTTTTGSTTTTTIPACDCTFCAIVTVPGFGELYFIGAGKTEADCDCLCKCGGIDRPCEAPNPCDVEVSFTPTPVPCG